MFSLLAAGAGQSVDAPLAGTPRVIDGDTLDLAGTRVRLVGIDAPEAGQTCTLANGRAWACGQAAKAALARLAEPGVTCAGDSQDRYGRLLAQCSTVGGDVGAAMVSGGLAWAYRRYSLQYVGAEQVARDARRGIWQGAAQDPATYRAAAGTAAPTGCAIKGNISAAGRIYHMHGQADYAATRISAAKGERWFCSETEAVAAGWRRARR